MKTASRFVLVALLGLESCGSSSLGGTYVATSAGQYRLVGGDTVSFTIPDDTFVVKENRRHYQHYEYGIGVRGCNVIAEGDADNASSRGDQTCTFDLPSIGPVAVQVSGGVSRERGSRFARDGAYVSLSGTGRDGKLQSFGYSLHGKPR